MYIQYIYLNSQQFLPKLSKKTVQGTGI